MLNSRPFLTRGTFLFVFLFFAATGFAADRTSPFDTGQPSRDRPELPEYLPEKPKGSFTLPPAPTPPKAVPGGATFELKGVAFEGNTVFSNEQLQEIAAPFVGQTVGMPQLEELRLLLTRRYVNAGYINSGAIIKPGQTVDRGILIYTIQEGRLERIDVSGNGRLRPSYIEDRLWPDPARPFNMLVLQERFQMLIQDPLIERMDGRILPGAAPGEATLDLNVTREQPYSLGLALDNHQPPSTGSVGGIIYGWVGNLTGYGDLLEASFGKTEGDTSYSSGFSIPVSRMDTRLSLRYSHNENAVIEEPFADIDIESELDSLEFSITHPLFRNLRRTLDFGAGLSIKKSKTFLLGEPFSFSPGVEDGVSRVSVIRLVQSYVERSVNIAFAARSMFSIGTGLFNATTNSYDEPDGRFLAWLGQAQYAHRLGERLGHMIVRGDLQLADDSMLSLEQFALGGAHSVRGYRENELVRDNGYLLSAEWRIPIWRRQAPGGTVDLVHIAPFMDFGAAWNRGEASSDNVLHSAGVGLLLTPTPWLSAEIYWAHRIEDAAPKAEYDLQDDGIHFRIDVKIF